MDSQKFFFVDIGNSRIKIAESTAKDLGVAISNRDNWKVHTFPIDSFEMESIDKTGKWFLCSVNQDATKRFAERISEGESNLAVLKASDCKIETNLDSKESTGIDRLCAAIAANKFRLPTHAAIVVDSGTAVTIDLISQTGVFMGGLIFPGISTSLNSLRRDTFALPQIELDENFAANEIVGRNTAEAIQRGVYWSHRGAVESIVTRMIDQSDSPIDLFVTGGGGEDLCQPFSRRTWQPNLVLEGVALAAASL